MSKSVLNLFELELSLLRSSYERILNRAGFVVEPLVADDDDDDGDVIKLDVGAIALLVKRVRDDEFMGGSELLVIAVMVPEAELSGAIDDDDDDELSIIWICCCWRWW